ncbi:hypothetical protein CLU96_4068 [Chryseobacterium sp. 52]|uniref:toxin-antitoxin system YwqK family antitoxin n=1 Tax=Chryseobacterium sp. 52 TaxID=2035213 RepID=UPI000C193898|nr:hypothetical protein [Chryseobacterium sp. 52]PIF47022.1 hypothetical protein CLU96_4068 [Chryseobacterium sp. 52]
MNFEIKNGKGLVSMGYAPRYYSESLSIGKDPVLFLWDDCDDPGDENLVLLPMDHESENLINNTLQDVDFNVDYTDRIEDLFSTLGPLFQLLKNGKYHLNFSAQKIFEDYSPIAAFGVERLDREEVRKESDKYDEKLKQNKFYDYTFHGAYDGTYRFNEYEQPFVAWKSEEEININLIQQYESMISSGERPFAIIFTGKCLEDDFLHEYILDGHHKLCAYKNLKIEPPCAFIKFLAEEESEFEMDIERISELIFPWQFNHFYDNWHGKKKYFKNNPDSSLRKYIKNGLVTFLYPDDRKRAESFYINDVPDGDFRHWSENGKISNIKSFSLGKLIGRSVYYHHDEDAEQNDEDDLAKRSIGYEYIYKDGDLKISKRWDRDGKISSIAIYEPKSIRQIPLTDKIIWDYSTEKYKTSVSERKDSR